MRVLITTLNAKYIHTNLAVRLLVQLNKHRQGLAWKEFTIKQDPDVVAQHCAGYDVVAFSCYIWNIRQTLKLVPLIRALNPQIEILFGGPEVSYEYDYLFTVHGIDYIIAGEGEVAFGKFLECYPNVNDVPSLVRMEAGVIIKNSPAPLFDLNRFTDIMPYSDDDLNDLRNKILYIETSRGCPYKCGFCLASLDNKVRYLPDSTIRETLRFAMTHGKTIKFLDRTFNIKKDFALSIFRFIVDNHRPGNVFQFEITADILHPEIIRYIREELPRGLFRFEIGIQTVNKAANLAVQRKQDFAKTRNIILQLRDHVEMHLDLIVGLPLDRLDDVAHSIEEVFALHPPELQLGFLKFLRGTPVRDDHALHGYEFDKEAPYEIVRSNYLSETELQTIRNVEAALEIYWNEGRARRTLKYAHGEYGIFRFLTVLGSAFVSGHGIRYSLNDIYDCLFNCLNDRYSESRVLKELAALDYYLGQRSKPEPRYLTDSITVNGKKITMNLSFNYELFEADGTIFPEPTVIEISYTGELARVTAPSAV